MNPVAFKISERVWRSVGESIPQNIPWPQQDAKSVWRNVWSDVKQSVRDKI